MLDAIGKDNENEVIEATKQKSVGNLPSLAGLCRLS